MSMTSASETIIEEITIKAKPASKKVRARALRSLNGLI